MKLNFQKNEVVVIGPFCILHSILVLYQGILAHCFLRSKTWKAAVEEREGVSYKVKRFIFTARKSLKNT